MYISDDIQTDKMCVMVADARTCSKVKTETFDSKSLDQVRDTDIIFQDQGQALNITEYHQH